VASVGFVGGGNAASAAGTGSMAGNLQRIVIQMTGFYQAVLPIGMSIFSDSDLLARHRDAVRTHGPGPERITEGVRAYLTAEQAAGRVAVAAPIAGARGRWSAPACIRRSCGASTASPATRRPKDQPASTRSPPAWWPRPSPR
jgi:hypothetical protein